MSKMNFRQRLIAACVAVTAVASQASAALTLPAGGFATTDYELVAGGLLVAGVVMWAIRKAIRLAGV